VVPGGASETWLPADLLTASPPYKLTADPTWVAGSIVTSRLRLDGINEAYGAPPNTGFAWPAGRHRITISGDANIFTGSLTRKLRVVSVGGGGAGSEVAAFTETHEETKLGADGSVEFDSVGGGTLYQPQHMITAFSGNSLFDTFWMRHDFIPALSQDEQFHAEPDNQVVHKRDSSGNLISELETEGEVPFDVPPGLTAIFIVPLDIPRPGYKESESVKGRTLTVSVKGAPRYVG